MPAAFTVPPGRERFMLYVLIFAPVFSLIAVACAIAKLFACSSAAPDFSLFPFVTDEELCRVAREMGKRDRAVTAARGGGMSVRAARKINRETFALLSADKGREKNELFSAILDCYRVTAQCEDEAAASAKRSFLLPHAEGVVRVYGLTEAIVKYRGGSVDERIFSGAVRAYCEQCPLTYAEICALPAALKAALVNFMAAHSLRAKNILSALRMGERDGERGRVNIDMLGSAAYMDGLWRRGSAELRLHVSGLARGNGFSLFDRLDEMRNFIARYAAGVNAAAESMRKADEWLCGETLLSFSPADEVFRRECGESYTRCTPDTRHMYLYRVAVLSRRRHRPEPETALCLAARALDRGEDISRVILPAEHGRAAQRAFVAGELALSAAAACGAAMLVPAYRALTAICAIPIALFCVNAITERVAARLSAGRVLPAVDERNIARTVGANLVVTRLVASAQEAEEAAFLLAGLALANPDERLSYTLLVDLPAARVEEAEGDEEIISALRRKLGEEKGMFPEIGERFNLLVRRRAYLAEKGIYQGHEKKRGALLDLNALILAKDDGPFRIIEGNTYRRKYVIALDSDTRLNCALRLVEIMEHPFSADKAVVSLRVNPTPESATATAFSRLYAGRAGLDAYTFHLGHAAYDLFGAGNYTGKGIYRVTEFDEAVRDAFPDGRIVSHDFIEGAYSGCAECDCVALDEFPSSYHRFFARAQRWLRGDCQLFPYLFRRVRDGRGRKVKNPLAPINKWHILQNVIFAFVPAATFALTVAAAFLPHPEVLLAAAYAPQILALAGAVTLISRPGEAAKRAAAVAFEICVLPAAAIGNLYSAGLTAVRLMRRRGLLEWKVYAHLGSGGGGLSFLLLAAGLSLVTVNAFFGGSAAVYALGFAATLGSPLVAVSGERRELASVKGGAREKLLLVAAKTWNYFAESCTEENNFLPPDNFRESDDGRYCTRTSPTNIGMALVAALSARELEIIDGAQAEEFIAKVVSSAVALPKWKGNLYNWYDIRTRRTLAPAYVSSVDSGNFLCCLAAARAAADERTKGIIDALIRETDLGALYDEKRGLMRIGYNAAEHSFDGWYDLAASEAAICYLVGVGTGKLPAACWNNLGRRRVRYGADTLYSWTGGAFEYLLTPMFFRYRKGTLAYAAAKGATEAQITYAARAGLDFFGASESQYPGYEDNGDYRYRADGVPFIALSGDVSGRTIAPYAGIMSLAFAPEKAEANLSAQISAGLLGRLGMYEAYCGGETVKSFMAHHAGMSMGAICNRLAGGAIMRAISSHPLSFAAELLLSSPAPRGRARRKPLLRFSGAKAGEETRRVTAAKELPTIGVFGSEKYSFVIDERGRGFALSGGMSVTRRRENCGFTVEATVAGERYDLTSGGEAIFCGGRAEYPLTKRAFRSVVSARAMTSLPGEMRTVRIKNRSDKAVEIVLRAGVEPTLTEHCHDLSHREYSNMFITAEKKYGGAYACRRKTGAYLGFYCSAADAEYGGARALFYGRSVGPAFGSVLDPMLYASVKLTIPRGEERETDFAVFFARSERELESAFGKVCSRGFLGREKASPAEALLTGGGAERAAILLYGAHGSVVDAQFARTVNAAYPTVYLGVDSERALRRAEEDAEELAAIYRAGIRFNLLVGYRESYGYMGGLERAVFAMLERADIARRVPPDCTYRVFNTLTDPELCRAATENCVRFSRGNTEIDSPLALSSRPRGSVPLASPDLAFECGKGGFTDEYAYFIPLDELPPRPWCNVIAAEGMGTLTSESGGGYTFAANSREEKITEWTNDSTLDPPSEMMILGERGLVWSVSPSPIRRECDYSAEHGLGYTKYRCGYNGIIATLTEFLGRTRVKYYMLELDNAENERREVSAALCLKMTLGDFAERTAPALKLYRDGETLVGTNVISGLTATLCCSLPLAAYTFNLRSMKNAAGEWVRAGGFSPLGGGEMAFSVETELAPLCSARVVFALSAGDEPHPELADEILAAGKKKFSSLGMIEAETGDRAIDCLLRWLPYQILCSRFLARTGFYQAGGAYGFRDQLQDAMALLYVDPSLTRRHLLRAARHQFVEGDVQHWWHPDRMGVRTRFVDDRLFLPLAAAEYVRFTGDGGVMLAPVEWLSGPPLARGEKSAYYAPEVTVERDTLLTHCLRAVFSVETDESGQVLMQGGDWNDAMDEVGAGGRGTTVFGTMLLYLAARRMLPFTEGEERKKLSEIMSAAEEGVARAFEGDRYVRARTDDGRVLGSSVSPECKIDLLTQAFAVLSGAAPRDKAAISVATADGLLTDESNKLIRLMDPPLKDMQGVGYIADYPAGVRENGGQYTHAAVWFVRAMYRLGKTERAGELLSYLLPINHARTASDVEKYKVEPYVMAADVYSGSRAGEGGWSWYTGAAGWMYKTIIEDMLGITIKEGTARFCPALPEKITSAKVRIRAGEADITVNVENGGRGEWRLCIGGVSYNSDTIKLAPSLNGREIVLRREKRE